MNTENKKNNKMRIIKVNPQNPRIDIISLEDYEAKMLSRIFNTTIMDTKELITITEYAKKKGVSVKTIYNWINAGMIKPVIIGKAKFIRDAK